MKDVADSRSLLSGFLLLKLTPGCAYRGVDRTPFEPTIYDSDLSLTTGDVHATKPRRYSELVKEEWRREAYELYEQNSVTSERGEISLIRSRDVALEIRRIILPHLGDYEVLSTSVHKIYSRLASTNAGFLGFDIAYVGGDFYSAVRNGLFVNPDQSLVRKFSPVINENGLFSTWKVCEEYLEAFRRQAKSEADSDFVLYSLSENVAAS